MQIDFQIYKAGNLIGSESKGAGISTHSFALMIFPGIEGSDQGPVFSRSGLNHLEVFNHAGVFILIMPEICSAHSLVPDKKAPVMRMILSFSGGVAFHGVITKHADSIRSENWPKDGLPQFMEIVPSKKSTIDFNFECIFFFQNRKYRVSSLLNLFACKLFEGIIFLFWILDAC